MKLSYDPDTKKIREKDPDAVREIIGGKTFAPPSLTWRTVRLLPLRTIDYEHVRHAETRSAEVLARWRFHGTTPSMEDWIRQTFSGTLATFLVWVANEPNALGVVTAYDASLDHGHVRIAACRFEADDRSPAMIAGIGLMVRHLFSGWNLRKIYMDVPEYNLAQFANGLKDLVREEGRLLEHRFYGGSYWDEVTFALYRDRWLEVQDLLLPSDS